MRLEWTSRKPDSIPSSENHLSNPSLNRGPSNETLEERLIGSIAASTRSKKNGRAQRSMQRADQAPCRSWVCARVSVSVSVRE